MKRFLSRKFILGIFLIILVSVSFFVKLLSAELFIRALIYIFAIYCSGNAVVNLTGSLKK